MEKIIHKFDSFEDSEKATIEYWSSRTGDERLEALLDILSLIEDDEAETTPRMERFFRITSLEKR